MALPPLHFNQDTFLGPARAFSCFHHVQDDKLWHDHDFFEIAWVLRGTGFHQTRHGRQRIKAGDLLFINTEEPHAYDFRAPLEVFNMLLGRPFLEPLAPFLPGGDFLTRTYLAAFLQGRGGGSAILHLPARFHPDLRALCDELVAAQGQELPRSAHLLALRFGLVLDLIAASLPDAATRARLPSSRQTRDVHRVMEQFHRDYAKAIDLAALARSHGFHPSSWGALFRSITGLSPMAYLVQVRLQKARVFLKYTQTPVSEVGRLSGFSQDSLFHRLFKKATGMSPRAYRVIRGEGLLKLPRRAAVRMS